MTHFINMNLESNAIMNVLQIQKNQKIKIIIVKQYAQKNILLK